MSCLSHLSPVFVDLCLNFLLVWATVSCSVDLSPPPPPPPHFPFFVVAVCMSTGKYGCMQCFLNVQRVNFCIEKKKSAHAISVCFSSACFRSFLSLFLGKLISVSRRGRSATGDKGGLSYSAMCVWINEPWVSWPSLAYSCSGLTCPLSSTQHRVASLICCANVHFTFDWSILYGCVSVMCVFVPVIFLSSVAGYLSLFLSVCLSFSVLLSVCHHLLPPALPHHPPFLIHHEQHV